MADYLSEREGVKCPADVKMQVVGRAWGTPIWYGTY